MMKRKRLYLLFLFSGAGLVAYSQSRTGITFDEPSHDFGTFTKRDTVCHVFRFTNTGDEAVIIYEAISSCPCMKTVLSGGPVAPGESGSVTVTVYGPKSSASGFRRSVALLMNTGRRYLYVQGRVVKHPSEDAPSSLP